MGWINESAPECEGYIVGIVPAENSDGTKSDWRYRELCFETDGQRDEIALRHVQMGCACGWRSPRIEAPRGTYWWPSIVSAPEDFEERCHLLWREHIELERARRQQVAPALVSAGGVALNRPVGVAR